MRRVEGRGVYTCIHVYIRVYTCIYVYIRVYSIYGEGGRGECGIDCYTVGIHTIQDSRRDVYEGVSSIIVPTV